MLKKSLPRRPSRSRAHLPRGREGGVRGEGGGSYPGRRLYPVLGCCASLQQWQGVARPVSDTGRAWRCVSAHSRAAARDGGREVKRRCPRRGHRQCGGDPRFTASIMPS